MLRQLEYISFFVTEIQIRLRGLPAVPIRPDSIKLRMGFYRSSHVRMVKIAATGKFFDLLPEVSLIVALPHGLFASGVVGLRACLRRGDNTPGALLFNIQRAHVIVIIRGGNIVNLPFITCPTSRMPGSRIILWT